MSQPSFTFSSLPSRSHSSALFTSSPSSVPFGRSPNSSGSSTLPLCDDDPSLPNSDHTLPPRKAHKLERQIYNDAMVQFSQVLNLDKSEALEANENIVNDDMERNISVGSTNSVVKRRAGKETNPSSPRLTRSASVNNLGMFIASDSKLAELAVTSPKKARRTLANRESAARSQEKKAKYIVELEGEIQALRAENTAIRALYNQLRNDHIAMENEHRELVIRYEGLEKQVQLHQGTSS
ncbi:unnamed protein product [Arabis nemorensis]|uniref:BZIP domain-containing protein n=1 Tax=Arabis nemorensis TaxID=586526 RepID=A0A565B1P9_9BRAS|nr:unnamed protein product [Arabis nemorensis]